MTAASVGPWAWSASEVSSVGRSPGQSLRAWRSTQGSTAPKRTRRDSGWNQSYTLMSCEVKQKDGPRVRAPPCPAITCPTGSAPFVQRGGELGEAPKPDMQGELNMLDK